MKLKVPLASVEEVTPLIEAGASEMYAGYLSEEWIQQYSHINSINARHTKEANFYSLGKLEEAVQRAAEEKVPVHLTMNGHYYTDPQLPLVLKTMEEASNAGVDSFIVADPLLLKTIHDQGQGYKTIVSTIAAIFNSEALGFYKDLGATRVVLPRHLTIAEMKDIKKQTDKIGLYLDAFVLNTQCPYIDGLCSFQHIFEKSEPFGVHKLACREEYDIKVIPRSPRVTPRGMRSAAMRIKAWHGKDNTECGMCAVPVFLSMGMHSVKIAGREFPMQRKIRDTTMVRSAITQAEQRKEMIQQVESNKNKFEMAFFRTCTTQNCFYPEVVENLGMGEVEDRGKSIVRKSE